MPWSEKLFKEVEREVARMSELFNEPQLSLGLLILESDSSVDISYSGQLRSLPLQQMIEELQNQAGLQICVEGMLYSIHPSEGKCRYSE